MSSVFSLKRSACLAVATFWNVVQACLEVACILHTESSHPAVLWEASITDVVKARQPRHKVCSSTLPSLPKKSLVLGPLQKKGSSEKKKEKKEFNEKVGAKIDRFSGWGGERGRREERRRRGS